MRYLHWRQIVAPILLLGMCLIQYKEEQTSTEYFRIGLVVRFTSHNGNYCCFECCFLLIVLTFKNKQTVDHPSINILNTQNFVKSKWKIFNHKTTRHIHFVLKDGSCSTKNLLV